VVLDASGRVRETYRQWEENRGGLNRLTPAPKSYKNLTVHCWQTGGGKSAFRENGRTLIEGIVETINEKPDDEEWLVVYHQEGIGMEFKDEVEKRITNKERVHFLNWGNHQATNDYSGVRNVILAGTLFYRPSYYEALARLAADLRPAQGAIGRATLDEVTLGEHRHLVLQALCRGSVRRCQGAECAPCDAYIIAATRSGIPAALPDIFPGCRVVRWQPVQKALSGKVKEAAEFVIDWFKKNPEGLLSFNIGRKAIGMDTQNFRKNVRRHPDFKEAVATHDIAEVQELGDNRRGFLKPSFDSVKNQWLRCPAATRVESAENAFDYSGLTRRAELCTCSRRSGRRASDFPCRRAPRFTTEPSALSPHLLAVSFTVSDDDEDTPRSRCTGAIRKAIDRAGLNSNPAQVKRDGRATCPPSGTPSRPGSSSAA
jgi:hypothetical protein